MCGNGMCVWDLGWVVEWYVECFWWFVIIGGEGLSFCEGWCESGWWCFLRWGGKCWGKSGGVV